MWGIRWGVRWGLVSGGVLGWVLGWVYRRGIKSVAIGGDQFQSVAISAGLQLRLQPSQCQPAISGNQWQTVAISGNHFPPEERFGHSTVM